MFWPLLGRRFNLTYTWVETINHPDEYALCVDIVLLGIPQVERGVGWSLNGFPCISRNLTNQWVKDLITKPSKRRLGFVFGCHFLWIHTQRCSQVSFPGGSTPRGSLMAGKTRPRAATAQPRSMAATWQKQERWRWRWQFYLVGGNSNIFNFQPNPWQGKWFPIWRSYFSKGLVQPPTRFYTLLMLKFGWSYLRLWVIHCWLSFSSRLGTTLQAPDHVGLLRRSLAMFGSHEHEIRLDKIKQAAVILVQR